VSRGRTRSYRDAGILATAARTCAADHTPPRGAEIPRSFNSFAIERSEFAPAVRMSSMTGARSAARDFAARDLARLALAQSAAVPARPRNPPSRLPRAFAAARAARVRPEIIFASCSAMAAMMWIVRRFACGKSTASNSTFDSIKLEMKAALRAKRSSLAIISLAP
jgi:hypothetical protein